MSQQAPENQDRGLFGLFGKKNEETEGTQNDQMMHPPATQTHNQPQGHAQGAGYYPTAAQHGGEQYEGQGHQGQVTSEEAEKKKRTGLMGKLHPAHGSGSGSGSSSSSDEEDEGKKKEGGRKKKGSKEKRQGGRDSSDQYGRVGEYGDQGVKKEGMMDKIKDKLPGHRNANE
jgi:hypothetical protein